MQEPFEPNPSASSSWKPAPAQDDYLMSFLRMRGLVSAYFDVTHMNVAGGSVRFEASAMRADWKDLRPQFNALGYNAYLKRYGPRIICTLAEKKKAGDPASRRENRVAIILFACTIITTLFAGYMQAADISKTITALALNTLSFPVALIFILGSHEMAHKVASKRNGIDSTPPYFIPAPSLTGTFGAVIRVKSPMPDDNAAVEMGLSGPIAGFIATIPILILGIALSPHVPHSAIKSAAGGMEFGEPLLFRFIAYVLLRIPTDHVILMNPLVFAGWVGLLVTMLNLMPIGQLDGGHISHALLGPKYHLLLSRVFLFGLVALGAATGYFGWYIWAVLGMWILTRGYPQPYGGMAPLKTRNIVYALIALAIFILCFMPAPISGNL